MRNWALSSSSLPGSWSGRRRRSPVPEIIAHRFHRFHRERNSDKNIKNTCPIVMPRMGAWVRTPTESHIDLWGGYLRLTPDVPATPKMSIIKNVFKSFDYIF